MLIQFFLLIHLVTGGPFITIERFPGPVGFIYNEETDSVRRLRVVHDSELADNCEGSAPTDDDEGELMDADERVVTVRFIDGGGLGRIKQRMCYCLPEGFLKVSFYTILCFPLLSAL
jgi:hypothetical protein